MTAGAIRKLAYSGRSSRTQNAAAESAYFGFLCFSSVLIPRSFASSKGLFSEPVDQLPDLPDSRRGIRTVNAGITVSGLRSLFCGKFHTRGELIGVSCGFRITGPELRRVCAREGIELVVVTTPVPAETLEANAASYEAAGAEMSALAESYGFRYLNYTGGELLAANKALTDADLYADWDGHMFADAAAAFSEVLARDLAG